MEALSLLKYWRGGGFGSNGGGGGDGSGTNLRSSAAATTIVKAVTQHTVETDDDDDGPFFDLEFAVQDEEEEDDEEDSKNDGTKNEEDNANGNQNDDIIDSQDDDDDGTDEEEDEEEREFNFTISSRSSSGNDRTDPNLTLSPSDDLFFKGRLVPIEPSSLVFSSVEPNSKSQFPVSLLKSATKFRVSKLSFKKSKQNASEKTEPKNGSVGAAVVPENATHNQLPKQESQKEKEKQSKFFTVKFKVEEVPIVSLFTRDNSSSRKSQPQKQNADDSASDEKLKFSKDVMQKYLKKVKPLYIRVSKRYGEKFKFSGQLSLGSAMKSSVQSMTSSKSGQKSNPPKPTAAEKSPAEAEVGGETQVKSHQKQANIPERLKVVCKHLGKSRSASSAVAAAPAGQTVVSRRDDSLLQQEDGIQSAILHCKRSFNASRDSDSSLLPRSISDPSHQKSAIDLSRKSSDEGKDCSSEP